MRAARRKRCPIVEVTWDDAASHRGWRDGYPTKESIAHCSAAGYLMYQDDGQLVLITAFGEGDQSNGNFAIPIHPAMRIRVLGTSKTILWDASEKRWRWHQA